MSTARRSRFALDRNGNVTLWSRASEEIFGWKANEVLGNRYPLIPPELRQDYETQLARVFSGETFSRDTQRMHKDGRRLEVNVTTGPIRDDAGQLSGILFLIADLTETQHLRTKARELEHRYRAIAESDLIGIFFWHYSGEIFDANDAFLHMTGYSREDIQSGQLDWREITAPEFLDATYDSISELRKTGFRKPYEKEFVRKDCSRMSAIVAGLTLDDERETGVACILDVSEQKQLQKQFQQVQKMEAVGRLAAGVAHDFNNLLSVIVGYAQFGSTLLPANSPVLAHMEAIITACDRATQLTRQLLAFSRQQALKPEPIAIDDVIDELTKILPRLIGEDITTEVVRSPDAGVVIADRTQLAQIILNLAVNARDAMAAGGTLTISTERVTLQSTNGAIPAGDYAVISVADTGCGMSAEVMGRIFEPFFTTKEPGKGTGLGLATVYGIVKQSGGYLLVKSETGKGSTFRVYLPRRAETAERNIVKQSGVISGSGRILLVEDENNVRQMMSEILTAIGYEITAPSSAERALELLRDPGMQFDLLLSDIVMPGMSGRKLAEEARKLRPDLPVVFMSGYADDDLIRKSVPGAGFVQKPVTVVELSSAIAEHLRAQLDKVSNAS